MAVVQDEQLDLFGVTELIPVPGHKGVYQERTRKLGKWIRTREAAKILKRSPRTIRRWCAQQRLGSRMLIEGGILEVDYLDVVACAERGVKAAELDL